MWDEGMKTKVSVGIEDFKEAWDNYYVVDKTNFICQLIDNRTKVSLFTQPRHSDWKQYGIILEFKVATSEKQLENKGKEALAQIEEKNYVIEFQRWYITYVWKYGIDFWGKRSKDYARA